MLDRAPDLKVVRIRVCAIIRSDALLLGRAVKQLQPEIKLGQNANRTEAGDAHLGPRALADIGDVEIERGPPRRGRGLRLRRRRLALGRLLAAANRRLLEA